LRHTSLPGGPLGRTWYRRGCVYLSVILRPVVAPSEVASLALAVALGVVLGLEGWGSRLG